MEIRLRILAGESLPLKEADAEKSHQSEDRKDSSMVPMKGSHKWEPGLLPAIAVFLLIADLSFA